MLDFFPAKSVHIKNANDLRSGQSGQLPKDLHILKVIYLCEANVYISNLQMMGVKPHVYCLRWCT